MRDADAITGGLVQGPAHPAVEDEFFDELCSNVIAQAADDDLDAFITRAATMAAATAVESTVAQGSAGLPSDIDVAKPQRQIRVKSLGSSLRLASLVRPGARRVREATRRIALGPRRLAAAVAFVGVLAAMSAVVSGSLSGTGTPKPATLAGAQGLKEGASRQVSPIIDGLARTTGGTRNRADKASHRGRSAAGKPRRSVTHPATSRPASRAAQPVVYVQRTAAPTASTVGATPSSPVPSGPTASTASANSSRSTGPSGAGAPFAPGQQVK